MAVPAGASGLVLAGIAHRLKARSGRSVADQPQLATGRGGRSKAPVPLHQESARGQRSHLRIGIAVYLAVNHKTGVLKQPHRPLGLHTLQIIVHQVAGNDTGILGRGPVGLQKLDTEGAHLFTVNGFHLNTSIARRPHARTTGLRPPMASSSSRLAWRSTA